LLGDKLTLTTQGSGKNFIVLKKEDARRNINGSVKFIDALYAVELVEAAPVVRALTMTNISIENSVLSFRMGPMSEKASIGFALHIAKKRTLASDITLFDRELAPAEIDLTHAANESIGRVNVENLGVEVAGGKFGLTAKAFFKTDGVVLNASQFKTLEATRTLVYTIR
jgi:hypothetical protein